MIWKIENRFMRALAAIVMLPIAAVVIALLLLIELAEDVAGAVVAWTRYCPRMVRDTGIQSAFRAITGRDAK